MKNHKRIKYAAFAGCLTLGATFTSCNDWLTLYPMDKIVEENFWEDKKDLESVRYAAYANMVSGPCMERYMVWGEMRADNFDVRSGASLSKDLQDIMSVNLKPSNSYFDWSSFYATINYCNKVLQHGPEILEKDKSFSLADWEGIRAEMIALRALNYFYLIRTFDEVPMVFTAINDDNEVSSLKATPQAELMDSLVNQMEYVVSLDMMKSNFGNNNIDNKGLITKKAVYAILADLYLWRGSYYEPKDKAKADSSYNACIHYCDSVINCMDLEYNKRPGSGAGLPSTGSGAATSDDNRYHLAQNIGSDGFGLTSDAYQTIFVNKNSSESIFELQFDGDKNANNLVPTYYRSASANGLFKAVDWLTKVSTVPDDDQAGGNLFFRTDLRRWATIEKISDREYGIVKYAASNVEQKNLTNNDSEKNPVTYSYRTNKNANWIFYRMPDILLMKAEAMCRIGTDLAGAFELVKVVNDRSNPLALPSEQLSADKANTQDALEGLILRERNREFVGEGKRWFDILRYAMRRGDVEGPKLAFSKLFGHKFADATISKKYEQNIKVMYSPYSEKEMKANSELVQNPIWNDQSTIQKK